LAGRDGAGFKSRDCGISLQSQSAALDNLTPSASLRLERSAKRRLLRRSYTKAGLLRKSHLVAPRLRLNRLINFRF
jgi:hypothetical protein